MTPLLLALGQVDEQWARHRVDDPTADLLLLTLDAAVPLWIDQYHGTTYAYRAARAGYCLDVLAHQADNILFKSKQRGGTAEAFNRLAEAIAILAFQPGGVRVFGRRWNARIPV